MKKTCVVFDMDGLIVDSERAYMRGWIHASKINNANIPDETVESWAGMGKAYIDNQVYLHVNDKELAKKIRNDREIHFWDALEEDEVELRPYAMEMINFCIDNNLVIGVATSSYIESASKILKHFDLYDKFDFHVFGDMLEARKPAPDIYNKAVKLSGKTKEECIAFEDSVAGVESAINAGLDVVYVPDLGDRLEDESKIYKKIDNLNEGIEILKQII